MGCNEGLDTLFWGSICKNHQEIKEIFVSEYEYVVNLDPAVMILPFGANIDIRDTMQNRNIMKVYDLGPNGGILTSLKGVDFVIGINGVPLHHIFIPHRVVDIT